MGSSLYLQGGAATQNTLKDTLVQGSHGFAVGSAVRYNAAGASGSRWTLARANNAENAEVVGVVSEVQNPDTFTLVYSGVINIPAMAGLSHPAFFLSDTVPGGITHNPPSVIGSVVKPVLVRSESNSAGYLVVNYLGTQIGGSSTVSVEQIQPVGTIMPYAGTAIPDTWLECNGVSYSLSDYPELYNRVQYDAAPRAPMYGHVVEITFSSGSGSWHGAVQENDIVLINNSVTSPTTAAFDMIGRVLTKTVSSLSGSYGLTVQILPKYDSSTKTLVVPNRVVAHTNTAIAYNSISLTTLRGSGPASVNTANIIGFNVPDLRSRFVLGRNATAQIETLENDTNYSSSLAAYPQGAFGGQESLLTSVVSAGSGSANAVAPFTGNLMPNMPPFLAVRYIIKAKPYTRAAIIGGADPIDWPNLLVTDIRSGFQRGGGVGEDLVFKTNTGTNYGTERLRLTNAGLLGIGTSTPGASLDVNGTIIASGGVTFAGTSDHTGVARFASGVTFAGTSDHTGVARFAAGVTFTDTVTIHNLATSSQNASGSPRLRVQGNAGALPASYSTVFISATGPANGAPDRHDALELRNGNPTSGSDVAARLNVYNGTSGLSIIQASGADGKGNPLWSVGGFDAIIRTGQANSKLHFAGGSNQPPHVTLDHLGRLGIGFTAPSVALHVNGEARSSTSTTTSSNAKTLTTKDYVDGSTFRPSLSSIYTACIFRWSSLGSPYQQTGGNFSQQIPVGSYIMVWFKDASHQTAGYQNERDTFMGTASSDTHSFTVTSGQSLTFGGKLVEQAGQVSYVGGISAIFFKVA